MVAARPVCAARSIRFLLVSTAREP
jgi:hypothetical protein